MAGSGFVWREAVGRERRLTSSSYAIKRNSEPAEAGIMTAVPAVGQVVGCWAAGGVVTAVGLRPLTTLSPDREIGFFGTIW